MNSGVARSLRKRAITYTFCINGGGDGPYGREGRPEDPKPAAVRYDVERLGELPCLEAK